MSDDRLTGAQYPMTYNGNVYRSEAEFLAHADRIYPEFPQHGSPGLVGSATGKMAAGLAASGAMRETYGAHYVSMRRGDAWREILFARLMRNCRAEHCRA